MLERRARAEIDRHGEERPPALPVLLKLRARPFGQAAGRGAGRTRRTAAQSDPAHAARRRLHGQTIQKAADQPRLERFPAAGKGTEPGHDPLGETGRLRLRTEVVVQDFLDSIHRFSSFPRAFQPHAFL